MFCKKINILLISILFTILVSSCIYGPQKRQSPPNYYDLWNDDFQPGSDGVNLNFDDLALNADGIDTVRMVAEVQHHGKPVEGTKIWWWAERGNLELVPCALGESNNVVTYSPVFTDHLGINSTLLTSGLIPCEKEKESVLVKVYAMDPYGLLRNDTGVIHFYQVKPYWNNYNYIYDSNSKCLTTYFYIKASNGNPSCCIPVDWTVQVWGFSNATPPKWTKLGEYTYKVITGGPNEYDPENNGLNSLTFCVPSYDGDPRQILVSWTFTLNGTNECLNTTDTFSWAGNLVPVDIK